MIPNLQELPPIPEEPNPLKKLVRPVLSFLLLAAFFGGAVWFVTKELPKAAQHETNVMAGLRSVAADLWMTGNAPEIRLNDPDLVTEVARLRALTGFSPQIVVLDAENRPGQPAASHEIMYLKGESKILSVRLFFDPDESKIDVLSYRTGPEYADPDFTPARSTER